MRAVATESALDLSTFPNSPYAEELQRGVQALRFAPILEREYVRSRLLHDRALIRIACVLVVVLALLRGVEQGLAGAWNEMMLVNLSFVIGGSIALAAVAWSGAYERLYLLWAPLLIPIRNLVISAQIGAAAAHGQPEMLMVLPIMMYGPFFFLGLRFRPALVCCLLTVVSYAASASYFGLAAPIAARSYVFLLVGFIAYIVAAQHLEKSSRRSFLEGHLIAELAQRDGLTGTRNRRVFDEHLKYLWRQALERRRAIAILLIDIDYFKDYNDRYGHQAGDQTLCRVAQTIQKLVRHSPDLVARYGGEEFAVILYDTDANQARNVADKMLAAVADLNIEHAASRNSSRVTVSAGVAAIEPTRNRSPEGALQLADQALYEAKVRGRNRVEVLEGNHHNLLVTGVFAVDAARLSNG
jgi:diguanylate cyclase (GGDEF)-like protein